jgi:hypothetical protein
MFRFIETYKKLAKEGISKPNLVGACIEELQSRGYYVKYKKVCFAS